MENQLIVTLLLVSFILCLFLAWYFSHKARHKERLLMIEKGVDDKILLFSNNKGKSHFLKIGIVLIGLSIGLVIITILSSNNMLRGDTLPLAILGICGGISMVIANNVGNINGK
ncbi:MAG TPA: DUF6249 domain-containing protein [Mucilaginibacter sp.]